MQIYYVYFIPKPIFPNIFLYDVSNINNILRCAQYRTLTTDLLNNNDFFFETSLVKK